MLHLSKTTSFALKLSLTAAAFWYVLQGLDVEHLRQIWHSQDRQQLIIVMGLLAVQLVMGAERWRRVLYCIMTPESKAELSAWGAFKIYSISVFFGNCMPGGAVGSDVVRVWLSKAYHIPMSLSINSVIIDRFVALVALLLLVMLRLPDLGGLMGFDADPILMGVAFLSVLGVWVLRNIRKLSQRFEQLPPVRWLLHFLGDLRQFARHPVWALGLVAYAMFTHTLYCVAAYVLAQSLGIEMTLAQSITLLPFVILAAMLPISIGGWGVREAGMAGMLSLIGIAKAPAVLLSVQLALLAIVVYMPAGLLWLAMRRRG